MNICKIKRSTQIAIMTGAGSGAVEKTASGMAPLTLSDSVAGTILGITINGRSAVSAGSIVSVGDNGLTVTTTNSDSTVTTSAVVITALPLRGVSDTVRDTLTCTAESKQVETVCREVDLGVFDYARLEFQGVYYFKSPGIQTTVKKVADTQIANMYMVSYEPVAVNNLIRTAPNHTIGVDTQGYLYVRTDEIDNVADFKSTMSGVKLVYELATPTLTPLTDVEISAFSSLKTYDPTTTISVTDNPSITVKYMGKNITRTAPKKRTSRKKKS